jgi:hypothetical protein
MPRHRLFRRRTRWGPVRDNLHIVVTVAALIATAFAWNAISNADQAPTPQVVSSDPQISQPAAQAPSSSDAEEMRVAATAETLPAPASPAHSGVPTVPPSRPKAISLLPVHGQPSSITEASSETTRATPSADATEIRGTHREARHYLRRNSPAATRAARSRRRISKSADSEADFNPFECKVRKKPPCFDENDRR